MKVSFNHLLQTTLFISFSNIAMANDGIDRYQKGTANQFIHFPDNYGHPEFGYRFLPNDQGGADGDAQFRWAQPHAVAIVRLAAHETFKNLGAAPFPMAIFDLASENGDTPISWEEGKLPKGRHPGGSHDGGLNLDLGYYMTSLKGLESEPDFSACTEHFKEKKAHNKKLVKDNFQCFEKPDHLAVEHQTLFFGELFKMNRFDFDNELLEEVGIDEKIAETVIEQAEKWQKELKFGITEEIVNDMKRVFVYSPWEGWAKFHHHHTHIRLKDTNFYGKFRVQLDTILQESRLLDQEILDKKEQAFTPSPRLVSYAMSRSIDMKILGDLENITMVKYSLDQKEWTESHDSKDFYRAVLDLPKQFLNKEKQQKVYSEVEYKDGNKTILESIITLPALDPRTAITILPENFKGKFTKNKNGKFELSVEYPDVYEPYVTSVSYHIFEKGSPVKEIKLNKDTDKSLNYSEKNMPWNKLQFVEAKIFMSQRKSITVTIFVNTNSEFKKS